MTAHREQTERIGEDYTPGPMPPIGSPLQVRALQIGAEQVAAGVCEVPPGSNRGPMVDRYLVGHDGGGDWLITQLTDRQRAWCCRAMTWCNVEAAIQLKLPDPFAGSSFGGGLASGRKLRDWARAGKRIRMICRPGLVGIIMHDNESAHVVSCWEILEGGLFGSLEGNSRNRYRFTSRAISEVTHWVELG